MSTPEPGAATQTGEAKKAWRRWMRRIAQVPPPAVNNAVVAALSAHLDSEPGKVLTYQAMPGELDLSALTARSDRYRFHVTRTPPSGPLTVHHIDVDQETHRYGFAQPRDDSPAIDPAEISIVLVPGVAFGRDGSRLGHGAGYYDQLLPHVAPQAHLIGVTWSGMSTGSVPTDALDVMMTHLVDETGLFTVTTPHGSSFVR